MKTRNEKSCGVVIYHAIAGERFFLTLHYTNGHWDLPKGHVEAGETEHETALRELEEETGITQATILSDFRETINYSFIWEKVLIQKEVVFFVANTSQQAIKLSHEHQGYQWLNYQDALRKLTFDNAKNLLTKAENFLAKRQ